MIKKLLYTGIFAVVGISILAGFYGQNKKQYSQRLVQNIGEEPNPMMWTQVNANTGEFDPMARNQAKFMVFKNASRTGSLGIDFRMRGPDNVGGRTRAVLELIGKPDTLLAGSVSGGLFVSYDAGGTWQIHEQFANQLESSSIIASIHQDTVSKKIYIGTGSSFDAFSNSAQVRWPGYGMFVSEDEGKTFTHLSSTTPDDRFSINGESWIAVNRIATTSSGEIYAATERGLLFSDDEGETWINPVFVDANQTTNVFDKCADVAITKDGKVIVSYQGGRVFLKESATTNFVQINNRGLANGGSRTVVAVSPSDANYIYVMFINGISNDASSVCLNAIFKSVDGGKNFNKILEPHDDFTPMGDNGRCQGVYDAAMGVSALDPNTIYIGGLSIWRYDGSLTRIASEGGSPPFQDVLPNYVHADKHYFHNSPNDKRRFYCTTDGGVTRSSDRGNTWNGLNKGYVTTQFYGVTHLNSGGVIIGGAQDNGTLAVIGDNANNEQVGYQVWGNDGIISDASQIMPIVFATSQSGLVVRADLSAGTSSQPPTAFFSEMGSSQDFNTIVELWENNNDLTSQDSILFSVEATEFAIATGNGIVRNFNESFTPVQKSAQVIQNSIIVKSSGMTLTIDPQNPGSLIGDGEGSVTFNTDRTIDISITFDQAPAENSNVLVTYEEKYSANSIIVLESENLRSLQGSYTFEHRLENALNPGDKIKVQDPMQSILFSSGNATAGGNIRMYRNVLNAQLLPPTALAISGLSGSITSIAVTEDGNVAFFGNSAGTVYRITGFNEVYNQTDANTKLTAKNILTSGAGGVTGIALDANDNNRMIITCGGYGRTDRVRYTENALATTPSFQNVHGDLATMPMYGATFNINDPNMVLIATEFGIWGTADITATPVVWTDENNALGYVPTYAIKQQSLPFEKASNTGMVYIGTHGRGFWESSSEVLVSAPEFGSIPAAEKFISDFKVYPNPVQGEGRMSFESSFNDQVDVMIYDINGRQVKNWNQRVASGNNTMTFNTTNMRSGSYFAVISSGGNSQTAKFLVLK